jgi:hypothetical protein
MLRRVGDLDEPVDDAAFYGSQSCQVQHDGSTGDDDLLHQGPKLLQRGQVQLSDRHEGTIRSDAHREGLPCWRDGGCPRLVMSRGQPVRRRADGPDDSNRQCPPLREKKTTACERPHKPAARASARRLPSKWSRLRAVVQSAKQLTPWTSTPTIVSPPSASPMSLPGPPWILSPPALSCVARQLSPPVPPAISSRPAKSVR